MSVWGFPLNLQWWLVRAMTPRRVVKSRGLRFSLQCENWITHYRVQTFNEKEPETLDWIDQWLREGDTLFDVGANIGVYTVYAALRHRRLRVIAFEPEYANLHCLRDNLFENGLQDHVEVYAIALSHRSGISQLHIQDRAPGSALHTESNGILDVTLAGRPVIWREGVFAVTLDEFCEQTGLTPHALKIDVDGTEAQILEGARKTLAGPTLRSVLIELPVNRMSRQRCEQYLATAGLHRCWADSGQHSANEIWARKP